MKSLDLNKLDLGAENLLHRDQLKNVIGGFEKPYDGFECANDYERCDSAHPDDFYDFQECMFWAGCLY